MKLFNMRLRRGRRPSLSHSQLGQLRLDLVTIVSACALVISFVFSEFFHQPVSDSSSLSSSLSQSFVYVSAAGVPGTVHYPPPGYPLGAGGDVGAVRYQQQQQQAGVHTPGIGGGGGVAPGPLVYGDDFAMMYPNAPSVAEMVSSNVKPGVIVPAPSYQHPAAPCHQRGGPPGASSSDSSALPPSAPPPGFLSFSPFPPSSQETAPPQHPPPPGFVLSPPLPPSSAPHLGAASSSSSAESSSFPPHHQPPAAPLPPPPFHPPPPVSVRPFMQQAERRDGYTEEEKKKKKEQERGAEEQAQLRSPPYQHLPPQPPPLQDVRDAKVGFEGAVVENEAMPKIEGRKRLMAGVGGSLLGLAMMMGSAGLAGVPAAVGFLTGMLTSGVGLGGILWGSRKKKESEMKRSAWMHQKLNEKVSTSADPVLYELQQQAKDAALLQLAQGQQNQPRPDTPLEPSLALSDGRGRASFNLRAPAHFLSAPSSSS